NNADLFVKRAEVAVLSRALAAAALLTLQTYAPSGGKGHRTSLRGGGPLTTLVVAAPEEGPPTLWAQLWPNVLTKEQIAQLPGGNRKGVLAAIFPWMGATRVSGAGQVTAPDQVHPLQAFWGMPRRIRLSFESAQGRTCSLAGPADHTLVARYRSKSYGTNYKGGWLHPLSPHYGNKEGAWLPVHAGQGGVSYRHWLGLIQDDRNENRQPAAVVSHFRLRRHPYTGNKPQSFRFHAFGYDMDNMKARCWYDETMPLHVIDASRRNEFEKRIEAIITAAGIAAKAVQRAVKEGLFGPKAEVRGDLGSIGERFWRDTERDFSATVSLLRVQLESGADPTELVLRWRANLGQAAERIFDDTVPMESVGDGAFRRIVEARRTLVRTLRGSKIATVLDLPHSPAPGRAAQNQKEANP
ncbi:MAG: type I-E CRISPR-associated protein Cse1/CasA, partial [Alphaproteobacteria bacterium]|nr:type I-E CRISPR-associated protein Cse1/CasA [Alphaproteobacteria bacterium]